MKTVAALVAVIVLAWVLLFSRPANGGRCLPSPVDVCVVSYPHR